MQTASLRMVFRLPECRSLKEKRRVRNKIRDRVRAKFDVAINEVEALDEHRQLVFGVAAVGNDVQVLGTVLDKDLRLVDDLYVAERVATERQISSFFDDGY